MKFIFYIACLKTHIIVVLSGFSIIFFFLGIFYPSTPPTSRAIQHLTTNPPQGPQNTPVANMSNAQNSHGSSLIVQSQPMEISTNSQPLQVSQQTSSTPMPITEARPQRRKNAAIKIINPDTGHEVVVDTLQAPVS